MRKAFALLICLALPGKVWATTEINVSAIDALKITATMLDHGDVDSATKILDKMPSMPDGPLEIERRFLLGRTAMSNGDFNEAIEIFRQLLSRYPDLARVRYELAICYMKTSQWRRADYQLRLAMAGNDLPTNARQAMNYLRYVIRQNKNWNAWFNFGIAPDNNLNTSAGGEECINTIFGALCRQLPPPEKAVGYNLTLGGNYEFKLSDQWRWKSEANFYTNIYNKHKFDDLYISLATGPRFVWRGGDIWIAATTARRWYGWDAYNMAAGGRAEINYDFTRKLSASLSLQAQENIYDDFGEYLDGETYGTNTRLTYSIDASKYIILRGGLEREIATDNIYSNWRPGGGAGFGIELPAGFNLYVDASVYWQKYDAARWTVKDGRFKEITEKSLTHRYSASVSNSRLSVWNFVPTVTLSYTRRDSNIWQREFDKWAFEFSIRQRF